MMKMKRTFFGMLCSLLVCLSFSVPAYAWSDMPLVVDHADILSDSEESQLLSKLENISKDRQMDIVVVTESSIGDKTPMEYADDFYDYNGYEEDGVLLLVAMSESKWHISTTGYGITAITDRGLEYMSDQFVGYLSDGEYYEAFDTYADLTADFIDQARTGKPYDNGNLPKKPFKLFRNLIMAIVIGAVLASVVTGSMKAQLDTVHAKAEAKDYLKKDSLKVTRSQDTFLYKHVDRIEKPKDSDSGSSTHTSSSGETHGGGGGSF